MGKIKRGVSCSVEECNEDAVRSLSPELVKKANLRINLGKSTRVYVCSAHYKQIKKVMKKEKQKEKWRHGTPF